MIRKWLLTGITAGALVAGLVGCQEQQQPPAPKAGTKKAATAAKPATPAKPGTKAKPATGTQAKPRATPGHLPTARPETFGFRPPTR